MQARLLRRRACDMELKVTSLDGKAAGSVTLNDEIVVKTSVLDS